MLLALFLLRTQTNIAPLTHQGVGASSWLNLPLYVAFHRSSVFQEDKRASSGACGGPGLQVQNINPTIVTWSEKVTKISQIQRIGKSTFLVEWSGEEWTSNLLCKHTCISDEVIITVVFTKKLSLKITGVNYYRQCQAYSKHSVKGD